MPTTFNELLFSYVKEEDFTSVNKIDQVKLIKYIVKIDLSYLVFHYFYFCVGFVSGGWRCSGSKAVHQPEAESELKRINFCLCWKLANLSPSQDNQNLSGIVFSCEEQTIFIPNFFSIDLFLSSHP